MKINKLSFLLKEYNKEVKNSFNNYQTIKDDTLYNSIKSISDKKIIINIEKELMNANFSLLENFYSDNPLDLTLLEYTYNINKYIIEFIISVVDNKNLKFKNDLLLVIINEEYKYKNMIRNIKKEKEDNEEILDILDDIHELYNAALIKLTRI